MEHRTASSKENAVVIVAAGRGSRIGDDAGPKQYRMIGTKSVLQRTIDAFVEHPSISLIQVVIHSDDQELFAASVQSNLKLLPAVTGGETRQISAYAGLKALEDHGPDNILIHDAARPFVDWETIDQVLEKIEPGVCTLPAISVSDTLKLAPINDDIAWVESTIPRDNLYAAQTPQGFVFEEILQAHENASAVNKHDFTDDAAVSEAYGGKVRIVLGNSENTKITSINDLNKANDMNDLKDKANVPDLRTGNGYDVHRLVAGDGVILCGIKIPGDKKLDGHSDADVGLHALTDALLGTIGSGDIGSHFPPSDPKWKGAKSDQFLAHACHLVREKSGQITHMDVTIVCEYPKIGPHRDAMRAEIAQICDVDIERVSVKATTNETIGSIGRGEGIAAIATATVILT